MALVTADRVVKRFATVTAVDELSFDVREGELVALLGPNGAGKTTAVRMLLGLIEPDRGTISWRLGADDPARPPARDLGYLPEERGLYRDQPVLRTLVYLGVLRGLTRADARREALAWLERLELGDRAEEKLDALSKGNQQKVQLVSALLHRPRFLILDEPFSGLDPINQEHVIDIIRELREAGTAVLLSAHQMALVERLADRVWLMAHGRTVLSGTLAEIRARGQGHVRLVIETDQAPPLEALAALDAVLDVHVDDGRRVVVLSRHGVDLAPIFARAAALFPIREVHSDVPTLHDIYVRTVREAESAPRGPDGRGAQGES
ncbi:MAG: ABC transporter ATP-binding protein [Bacteroidales bacterium]